MKKAYPSLFTSLKFISKDLLLCMTYTYLFPLHCIVVCTLREVQEGERNYTCMYIFESVIIYCYIAFTGQPYMSSIEVMCLPVIS